jgi:tetratricopeptide (TPR) repeat protein
MKPTVTDGETRRLDDIFISYSRKDREFVRRLDQALRQRKHEAWVDWDDIHPAEEFMQAIRSAIERTDAFVFVLSPDSVGSQVCGREVAHAVSHNKRLIPIVAREVDAHAVPGTLAGINWIFCRESDDFDTAVGKLIDALDTDLGWVRHHTRLLTRAIEWKENGNSSSFALRGEDLRSAEQWLAQAGAERHRQPTELQTEYILASRRAATRRQRMMLGAVSFGFLVSVVLAILAFLQRQEAIRQKAMAVAGRDRADEVIRFTKKDLPDRLRPIGRLDLMEGVIVEVDKYYDAMRKAEGESFATLDGKVWVLVNQGFIAETKGRDGDALAKYRSALQVAKEVQRFDPGSVKAMEDEASIHGVLAASFLGAGQEEAGVEENRQFRQGYEKLVARDPSNAWWRSQVATSYESEAWRLLRKMQFDEALAPSRKALGIRESLVAQGPEDSQRLSELARGQGQIALVLQLQHQFEPAMDAYRSAQNTIQKLTQIDPKNAHWQRDLAWSYRDIGTGLSAQKRYDLALVEYEKHAEAMDKVAAGDRANAVWQKEAYGAQYSIATTCLQFVIAQVIAGEKGDLNAATQAVERGLGALVEMEKRGPLSPELIKPQDLVTLRESLKNMGRRLQTDSAKRAK